MSQDSPLKEALLAISKVSCPHHKEPQPGESEACNGCVLQIIVYDYYCLANYTLPSDLKNRSVVAFDEHAKTGGSK